MQTRILPREEYVKLVGTELETVAPILPVGANVVVVEDGDELLACCVLMPFVHWELSWVKPSKRGSLVFSKLVKGMQNVAAAMGAKTVVTASLTPGVDSLIDRLGGVQLPGKHFVIEIASTQRKSEDT